MLTSMEFMVDLGGDVAHLVSPPAGLLLHMTRCGSTLAAKALAALRPRTVVLLEPSLFQFLIGEATNEEVASEVGQSLYALCACRRSNRTTFVRHS